MLASVSCVLKEAMVDQLDAVVARILQALQSEDGITVSATLLRRPLQYCVSLPLHHYRHYCVSVLCACCTGSLCHVGSSIFGF